MRNVLKSHAEVAHYWANQVQPSGKAGNMFFEDGKLYSYGRHFVIARHLGGGVVAFTKRGYSSSTSKHISIASNAARHLKRVNCADPDQSAACNRHDTQLAIEEALANALKPRIRQATREAHRVAAYGLADEFNHYLAALPADERGDVQPFDLTGDAIAKLSEAAAERAALEAEQARLRIEQRKTQLAETVAAWRDGGTSTYGLHGLPVMLRLRDQVQTTKYSDGRPCRTGTAQVIETSHGAEIPATFAHRLWTMVQDVRKSGVDTSVVGRVGHYTLTMIRANGSIVVGCHDIAYSEIERIAVAMGFVETATA